MRAGSQKKKRSTKLKPSYLKSSIKLVCFYPGYQGKREKTKITNTRNKRGAITNDPMIIKMIIKEYYEKPYAHKFGNLDEMN